MSRVSVIHEQGFCILDRYIKRCCCLRGHCRDTFLRRLNRGYVAHAASSHSAHFSTNRLFRLAVNTNVSVARVIAT